ncbi:MAG: nucleotidyltransferase family protein [Gemmatimonadales bacterium]
MRFEPDIVDRALVACASGEPDDPGPAADLLHLPDDCWEEFTARCRAQRLSAIAYSRIASAGLQAEIPPATLETLRRRYRNNSIRNLWLQEAIHSVVSTCHEAGIEVILLKGAYIATRVYDNPALREMGDIDLLVRQAQLHDAVRLLQEHDFRSEEPLPDEFAAHISSAKHVPRLHRAKAAVELHWTIFRPNRNLPIEIDGLWQRAIATNVARVDTLVLSPEDLLLHVCGHATYDHRFQFGLRPLVDIDRLIRASDDGIHWPTFIERTGTWGWQRGVYLALYLARELIGTPLPDNLLEALAPLSATPQVIDSAARMVFTDPSDSRALHLNVVDWHHGTLAQRVRLLYERMRWHPEHVEPTVAYYARHIPSLFRRHLPNILRLSVGNRSTRRLADGKRTLAAWLQEDEHS